MDTFDRGSGFNGCTGRAPGKRRAPLARAQKKKGRPAEAERPFRVQCAISDVNSSDDYRHCVQLLPEAQARIEFATPEGDAVLV